MKILLIYKNGFTVVFILSCLIMFSHAKEQMSKIFTEETLSDIDTYIENQEKWNDDNEILENLQNLSDLIGFNVQLSYYVRKPDGFISEFEDIVNHIHHRRNYVYSTMQSELGASRIQLIYTHLKNLSSQGGYDLFYKSYSILVEQICLPEAESDLESLLIGNNYKKQIGAALLLGEVCNTKSIELLKKILSQASSETLQIQAASALLSMDIEDGRNYFRNVLNNHPNQLVQKHAIRNLSGKGGVGDIDFLLDNLFSGEIDADLQDECFRYISRQSPRLSDQQKNNLFSYYGQIKDELFDDHRKFNQYISALYELGGKKGAEELVQFLFYPEIQKNEAIRVISFLGFLQHDEYLPYIIPFLHCKDESIRNYALFSIENLLREIGDTLTKEQMFELYSDLDNHSKKRLEWWDRHKKSYIDWQTIDYENLNQIQSTVQRFSKTQTGAG